MARGMMWSWRRCELADQVAVAAARALACALATTPKPGVADRAERGEWDKPGVRGGTAYFSFLDSTAALLPYFRDCATAGFDGAADAERSGEGGNPRAAFESLCGAGKLAQAKMAKITGNADAHKGLIFSLGVLCAAYGWLRRTKTTLFPGELFDTCRDMTEGVMGELSDIAVEHAKVCVERGAALSGVVGIRGEVSRGFPNVREYSLPMLRGMLQRGHGMNDAGLAAFLALLAHVDDMAILNDSNAATLHDIQRAAAEFLASNPSGAAMRRWAGETDLQFADRGISAGGCADLLVVTFFVWNLFRD
jgi:holo-ACP synthase/triphosphoribosyl-dephospho-CoA synthase